MTYEPNPIYGSAYSFTDPTGLEDVDFWTVSTPAKVPVLQQEFVHIVEKAEKRYTPGLYKALRERKTGAVTDRDVMFVRDDLPFWYGHWRGTSETIDIPANLGKPPFQPISFIILTSGPVPRGVKDKALFDFQRHQMMQERFPVQDMGAHQLAVGLAHLDLMRVPNPMQGGVRSVQTRIARSHGEPDPKERPHIGKGVFRAIGDLIPRGLYQLVEGRISAGVRIDSIYRSFGVPELYGLAWKMLDYRQPKRSFTEAMFRSLYKDVITYVEWLLVEYHIEPKDLLPAVRTVGKQLTAAAHRTAPFREV